MVLLVATVIVVLNRLRGQMVSFAKMVIMVKMIFTVKEVFMVEFLLVV